MEINDCLFIGDKDLKELLSLFRCNVRDNSEFYEVVACNIEKNYEGYLLNNIDKFKGKRLRGALFGLAVNKDTSKKDLAKIETFLNYPNNSVVLSCINTLILLKSSDSWDKIKPLLKARDPYIRGASLRFASFKFGKEAIPLLLSYIKDKSSIVKMTVIDELEDIGEPYVVKYLEPLLLDKDETIRLLSKKVIKYLKEISGSNIFNEKSNK